ncbi:MAG: dihydrodipicolinate reductase [Candidatus Bathyarchaeia archaeon]
MSLEVVGDMGRSVNVGLYGVGEISSLIARELLNRGWAHIVSAIDVAEGKVGRDLGEVLGLPHRLGLRIARSLEDAFQEFRPDIIVHATTSNLKDVYPQISECVERGVNIISTCEELVYPYWGNAELAHELDKCAKKQGVSVLGTGVNPGFIMDTLPIVMTCPCLEVEKINVTRVMDSGKRRSSYQRKIGTGLTLEEFREKVAKREITGHVGLSVSIAMIAEAIGWSLKDIVEEPPEPVLADETVETSYTTIKKGSVAGLKSTAYGLRDGEEKIRLNFISHAGVKDEYDYIEIKGKPSIRMRIEGGIHGDIGTAAIIINSIPKVISSTPGLHTMMDLPIPSAALKGVDG